MSDGFPCEVGVGWGGGASAGFMISREVVLALPCLSACLQLWKSEGEGECIVALLKCTSFWAMFQLFIKMYVQRIA